MKERIISVLLVMSLCAFSSGCDDASSAEDTKSTTTTSTISSTTDTTSTTSTTLFNRTKSTTTKKTTTKKATTSTTTTKEYNPTAVSSISLPSVKYNLSGFTKVTSPSDFKDYLTELNNILSSFTNKIGFSYENMDTGASISFNSSEKFATCSTIKAPFVKSLLANNINLDDKITKTVSWSGDDGLISKEPMGKVFTARELIKYTIQRSDNTAYYNLKEHYGYNAFNTNQYKIGSNYYLGDSYIFTYASSNDMLQSYKDIYNYAKSSERGKWLIKLLQKTDLNTQIGAELGDKYKVAQKYGTDKQENQYHDCAIVYSKSPYVLTIMTEQPLPESEEANKIFRNLARVIDKINNVIYTK